MISTETKLIIQVLVRSMKMAIALFEKVLKGEPI
jgi:hypothetical protein